MLQYSGIVLFSSWGITVCCQRLVNALAQNKLLLELQLFKI